MYEQEYGASFVDFSGKIYYGFDMDQNAVFEEDALPYDDRAPLILCFDFNVEPGCAVIVQEGVMKGDEKGQSITMVIDEVHIPVRSNTKVVVQEIIDRYKKHKGYVKLYGDATGGAEGTAKLQGSDWDIIKGMLRPVFGNRLLNRVGRANPKERQRVNAMNSRMSPIDGPKRLVIDGIRCPELILDLEGVTALVGTNGRIDKRKDLKRTHWSDALGYYVYRKHRSAIKLHNVEA